MLDAQFVGFPGECTTCGYDLAGIDATRCPECGVERLVALSRRDGAADVDGRPGLGIGFLGFGAIWLVLSIAGGVTSSSVLLSLLAGMSLMGLWTPGVRSSVSRRAFRAVYAARLWLVPCALAVGIVTALGGELLYQAMHRSAAEFGVFVGFSVFLFACWLFVSRVVRPSLGGCGKELILRGVPADRLHTNGLVCLLVCVAFGFGAGGLFGAYLAAW